MTKIQLTQELVRELFDYKEGVLYWKKSGRKRKLGAEAGTIQKYLDGNRARIGIKGEKYLRSRLVFLYHKGYMPLIVDHDDHNKLNDKINNLREADYFKNNQNVTSFKNSSSKYLGVDFTTLNNKRRWKAQISGGGDKYKKSHIGLFEEESDAALAYNREAVRRYGEFANLNIVQPV